MPSVGSPPEDGLPPLVMGPESGVLGQLLAAHALLQRLPGTRTSLEFVTHALRIVPGILAAAARLPEEGIEVIDGDWRELGQRLPECRVDRTVGYSWNVFSGTEVVTLELATLGHSYGCLYALCDCRIAVEPYLPFLANLASSIGLSLENQANRRAAEAAADQLLATKLQYELLFQEMTSGFAVHEIICDADGKPVDYRFLRVNRHFEELTGLRAEDIVGKTILEVLPSVDRSWIESYGEVALKGIQAHFERPEPSLGRYYEVVAYSPRRGQFATVINDITDRKRQEEELSRSAAEMEQAYQREHTIAESLQRAMLPSIPETPGLEIDAAYRSASEASLVGGDFYDVLALPDGWVAVIIGDVCGKGIFAAARMTEVRSTFRATARLWPDPGEWLSAVNGSFAFSTDYSGFVTAAVTVLNPETGAVRYAVAGHPAPLLITDEGLRRLAQRPAIPLGVETEQSYKTNVAMLPPRGVMVLFTDGLTEARTDQEQFGERRLEESLPALLSRPLAGSAAWLANEAQAFAGGRLVDDTVVVLVRRSTPPRS